MQFSIVIPAKNEQSHIGRCLDSIAAMECPDISYEVIVVDNGSSDNTVAVARQKGAKVYVQPDLTISGLRNFGAVHSSGRIIAFLDADCAVASDWLCAASVYLNDSDGVAAFGSPAIVPTGATWVQNAWFNVRGKPGEVIMVDWLESANLFVKRGAFLAVWGFDESLVTCEDYDLTRRLISQGSLISDHRVTAVHFREPATVADFMKKEMWRSKSNYKGILRRRVDRSEIPSLVMPLLYLLVLLLGFFFLSLHLFGVATPYLSPFLFACAALQTLVVLVCIRKNRERRLTTACQLFVLINLYFLARGLAVVNRS